MRFLLKTIDATNRVQTLELDVPDEATARESAASRGLAVLSLSGNSRLSWKLGAGAGSFSLLVFSIELLALLDAGLNVVEALQTLATKESAGPAKNLLDAMVESLRRGEPLSRAIASHPDRFPPLYVATLRSSEQTGNVREALSRYIAWQEEFDRVRRKARSALVYPAILAGVGTLVLAFLLFYVVPRFAKVYADVSTELPFFSAALFALGRWIGAHGTVVLALIAALVIAGVGLVRSKAVRTAVADRLWTIPALGERLRVYELSRFYRTVGMLLRSGIPALRALDMVTGLLAANLAVDLDRARRLLAEGRSISDALTETRLATPVATRMMEVGERAGNMGEMMERIARFHDEETARSIDTFTRVFEPVLMAVIGIAVGGVVVLLYMPIFELAGSVR